MVNRGTSAAKSNGEFQLLASFSGWPIFSTYMTTLKKSGAWERGYMHTYIDILLYMQRLHSTAITKKIVCNIGSTTRCSITVFLKCREAGYKSAATRHS